MTVTLIGGPFDGAAVEWVEHHVDLAFPNSVDATYVWYRLCTDRKHALYWPIVDRLARRPRDRPA